MKTMLKFLVVLAAACGGKQAPAGADKPAPMGEHPEMGPEMTRFHDVLAPRWHAEKGAQRMADTCAAIGDFQTNAASIAGRAAPPSAEAASWTTATKELTEAVSGLDAACKANTVDVFEPAFARVHTVFHAVMELGEAKGEHAGGEHAGHAM